MTRKPPRSLQQMAAEADGGGEPLQIAGMPADKCPYCGATMFAYKTSTLDTRINRYVECKKPRGCGRRFLSRQPTPPQPTIVREVSSPGSERLTLVRESA